MQDNLITVEDGRLLAKLVKAGKNPAFSFLGGDVF